MRKSFVEQMQTHAQSPAVQGTALALTAITVGGVAYFGGKAAIATAAFAGGCLAAVGATYVTMRDGATLVATGIQYAKAKHREVMDKAQRPVAAEQQAAAVL